MVSAESYAETPGTPWGVSSNPAHGRLA